MDRYGQAPSDAKTVYAEMLNPKVQVYGNTAVLTYNYLGYTKDAAGHIKPSLFNSTRVYVKEGPRWSLFTRISRGHPLRIRDCNGWKAHQCVGHLPSSIRSNGR